MQFKTNQIEKESATKEASMFSQTLNAKIQNRLTKNFNFNIEKPKPIMQNMLSLKYLNQNKKMNLLCTQDQYSKKKGNWLEFEDQLLLEWVEQNGPLNWTECSKRIEGRCGKQCRERWVNALDPRIKRGNWEEKEHTMIFEQMKRNWSSWTVISKKLPGRTENAIKNYFYSSIRRLRISELFKFIRIIIGADELIKESIGKGFD
jgi:hypothetical protein